MKYSSAHQVAIAVVTFNSETELEGCFAAIDALSPSPAEVVILDNASSDGSLAEAQDWAKASPLQVKVIAEEHNVGFAEGMNLCLRETESPWFFALNPDARPEAVYLQKLVELATAANCRAGALTGRLRRPTVQGEARLDACGMVLTPTWRHLDRGSGEPDDGRYSRAERVFGATGAAALYWREALEDVALQGEIFDSRFFSFREDAELCFRLAERGWSVLYHPEAHCLHRRYNLPSRRRKMPAMVNYHSLKNRYLLRLYHQTWGNFFRTLPWTLIRDVGALIWVIMGERSSLPAYRWIWQHRKELLRRRKEIQGRRTEKTSAVDQWFQCPALPLNDLSE